MAHNLKGTSKAVGFDQLAELTHTAEDLILKLKEGELEVTDEAVTALLDFKDYVVLIVEGLQDDLEATFEIGSLQKILKNITNGTSQSEVASETSKLETPNDVIQSEKAPAMRMDTWPSTPDVVATEQETPELSAAALESIKNLE